MDTTTMNTQDHNQSIEPTLNGVILLQNELRQLAFSIEDPPGVFGGATQQAVLSFQRQHDLPISGVADERTVALIAAEVAKLHPNGQPPRFVVRGQIRQADGRPLADATVRAIDKNLRSEEPLGETRTDEAGRYEIAYTAEQFGRAEKGSTDVSGSNQARRAVLRGQPSSA
jgi:peptidoglycan hydrolase-like protein with peptidoglycan-binding domain